MPIIAGNWKMYKTLAEAIDFVDGILPAVQQSAAEVLLAVPFTLIRELSEKVKGTALKIGAQNMNDCSEGAFTGEVSACMLLDAGAEFVLLGHSERRIYFKESDAFINKKVKRALSEGLRVILCIGESFDEHEQNRIKEALEKELLGSLDGVEPEQFKNIVIAYEPIWAIGSGKAASPQDVENENLEIRAIVANKWGKNVADALKILYGGSINSENAQSFLAEPDINGLLVGTASLNKDVFAKIVALTQK